MRVEEAGQILEAAGVGPEYWSLHADRDSALTIRPVGQRWHVYVFERGSRFEERTFDSEDEACVHLVLRALFFSGHGSAPAR